MTTTIGFKSVLTSLPVTEMKKSQYRLESDHNNGVLQSLAEKYKEQIGIMITPEYQLHILHVDDILKWEETKEAIGPYFTSILTNGYEDPLRYISRLLATARGNKNIVVIEVDDKCKLDKIQHETLMLSLAADTVFIE